ncbi:sugar transferase [Thalassoglobus polymorphus]|uniref:Undecaprenyl-phosphate N-acetylgalactosaminyl 1-phosphate transferase n=1 Tax=Thalassoglobus polymorphus TaxID=2527994 RepID=A0A517QSP0_9PLAN|nr:sugar transferase [Thalassoglobus polymorphus]QDT34631.1 Putative undecaprenyl-phosphate N-acetylgalactosaminyl 1-phosphate transferase [Thalassoglobus polymorphus]
MKVVDECLGLEQSKQIEHVTHHVMEDDTTDLDKLFAVPDQKWYMTVKTFCDFILAAIFLTLLFPVILLAALIVKITSPGPAFYFQERLGLNGSSFTLIKLRTMKQDAESKTGAVWAKAEDDRITGFGHFLRRTQIDEFPQLINVLLGQMSLIGPRPERPELANKLELDIPNYKQRLHVKPGITGLAQLRLPADTDVESVRRKLIPDLYYVINMSPWLDLRILMFTATYFCTSLAKVAWSAVALPTVPVAQQALLSEASPEQPATVSKAS